MRALHAADIHLDSPLRGLSLYEDAPVDELRPATCRAFDNLVDAAIDEDVDLLLLAGDVFAGDWLHYMRNLVSSRFTNELFCEAKRPPRARSVGRVDLGSAPIAVTNGMGGRATASSASTLPLVRASLPVGLLRDGGPAM